MCLNGFRKHLHSADKSPQTTQRALNHSNCLHIISVLFSFSRVPIGMIKFWAHASHIHISMSNLKSFFWKLLAWKTRPPTQHLHLSIITNLTSLHWSYLFLTLPNLLQFTRPHNKHPVNQARIHLSQPPFFAIHMGSSLRPVSTTYEIHPNPPRLTFTVTALPGTSFGSLQ